MTGPTDQRFLGAERNNNGLNGTENWSRLKFSRKIIETSSLLFVATRKRATSIAGYLFGNGINDDDDEEEKEQQGVGEDDHPPLPKIAANKGAALIITDAATEPSVPEKQASLVLDSTLSCGHPVNLLLRELSNDSTQTPPSSNPYFVLKESLMHVIWVNLKK